MKKTIVHENLNSFLNESQNRDSWISPEEASELFSEAIESSDTVEEAADKIAAIFDQNYYMHEELGEIEGHDFYKDAIGAAVRRMEEKWPGSFDMSNY